MKGLLYKDHAALLFSYRKTLPLLLVLYSVLSFVNRTPFMLCAIPFLTGIFVLSSFNFDEYSHFDAFARSLPVTPAQVVWGKYLLGLEWLGLGMVPAAVLLGLMTLFFGTPTVPEGALGLFGVVVSLILGLSFSFPFLFWFGAARARSVMLIFVMALVGLLVLIGQFMPQTNAMPPFLQQLDTAGAVLMCLGILVAAGIFYAISALISLRIYQKKEL